MAGVVVEDRDNGYAETIERIRELAAQGASVDVGILAKDGAAFEKYQNGSDAPLTILEVAIINHFGTEDGHVPPRPFISGWFDDNENRLREELVTMLQTVVAGKRTVEQALDLLGQRWAGEIQARIARHGDGTYAENKASTIKAKGSSTPLIRFGAIRGAVSYQVNLGGNAVGEVAGGGESSPSSAGREHWSEG